MGYVYFLMSVLCLVALLRLAHWKPEQSTMLTICASKKNGVGLLRRPSPLCCRSIGLTLSTPGCLPRHHGAGLSINSVCSQPQFRERVPPYGEASQTQLAALTKQINGSWFAEVKR